MDIGAGGAIQERDLDMAILYQNRDGASYPNSVPTPLLTKNEPFLGLFGALGPKYENGKKPVPVPVPVPIPILFLFLFQNGPAL